MKRKVVALNFPPKNGGKPHNTVVGFNIFTYLCGDDEQEDSVYMSSGAYEEVFGKTRKESSRSKKQLAIVKIRSKKSGLVIRRKYVNNIDFVGLDSTNLALNPASIRELCNNSMSNADIVGSDVVVSKGCVLPFYWYHPKHSTRFTTRVSLFSFVSSIVFFAISQVINICK